MATKDIFIDILFTLCQWPPALWFLSQILEPSTLGCVIPPFFISDLFRKYLICLPIISGYPKHKFFFRKKIPKIPARPP